MAASFKLICQAIESESCIYKLKIYSEPEQNIPTFRSIRYSLFKKAKKRNETRAILGIRLTRFVWGLA